MALFTDDELAALPDNDELAFVAYEKKLRDELLAGSGRLSQRIYASHILAFLRVREIEFDFLSHSTDREVPGADSSFDLWFTALIGKIDEYIMTIRLKRMMERQLDIVPLISFSQDYKIEIHKLLDKVRKVINATDLHDTKKDAIYQKIAALQAEVDRSKTRFDALLSRYLDIVNVVGESAERLEPLAKLIERVMKIFARAKADHDQGLLPAPDDTKRIPPPHSEED
jgi:hypothetical protein